MAQSSPKAIGSRAFKTLVSDAITQADTGTTVSFEIPAESWVVPYGVSVYVAEAFAGGSPSLAVGDGDDGSGWVSSSDITEDATGWYTGDATHSAFAPDGKYYGSADTIDVTVSASLTNGTAYVVVRYWDLSACDLAAST